MKIHCSQKNKFDFQEDYDYLVNEGDGASPSIGTENSTRKSQRTPKKKVIVEYGSIPERRERKKGHAKNRLEKSHFSGEKTRRPNKPTHIPQHSSLNQLKNTENGSPQKEQIIKHHNTIKNLRIRKPTHVRRTAKKEKERRPEHTIRYDGIDHYPFLDAIFNRGTRCKMEGCQLKSQYYCVKCKVHLCLKRNKNCFQTFHIISS